MNADGWAEGEAYEAFMGRWSRPLAERFIQWLSPRPGLAWLDLGCGTGALTSAVLRHADPSSVVACDPSESFVEHVRRIEDRRVSAVVAGAGSLPERPGGFDALVSGLVINFLPDAPGAIREMCSRASGGGVVGAYVWDYAGKMEFLRCFWDEAVALDPAARAQDEGVRFPMCRRDVLESTFRDAGLNDVTSTSIDVETRFESFSDYWEPFLGGAGPAASYVASLSDRERSELKDRLERRLEVGEGGAIDLVARAWAVRGFAP